MGKITSRTSTTVRIISADRGFEIYCLNNSNDNHQNNNLSKRDDSIATGAARFRFTGARAKECRHTGTFGEQTSPNTLIEHTLENTRIQGH
jgi:hypothetical protein